MNVTEKKYNRKEINAPSPLKNKVLFITGSSRGIGKAIALRAARDGAHIAVIGKTDLPHTCDPNQELKKDLFI